MPMAVYALTAGAFGIGTTEFVIMGLLQQVSQDIGVSISDAGLLISGYALGVFLGAPILTLATRHMPRKSVLVALMVIFTIGNVACALAPDYWTLMAARVITSLAHGTFFGVGSVVATSLVSQDRKVSAIAIMFTGLTAATLLGVPFGSWVGLAYGWRAPFWAVAAIGIVAILVLAVVVPSTSESKAPIASLKDEMRVLGNAHVPIGLLTTVLGFAGVFAFFTYIQPILTEITGFSEEAISPILLVFSLGLAVGNVAGGKLADWNIKVVLVGTLAALVVVLLAVAAVLHQQSATVVLIAILGVSAFATIAPLQLRVLNKAGPAGQNLASSLNIAAFNLGNAIGAWLGGHTIDSGAGLEAVPVAAAIVTAAGLGFALVSVLSDRTRKAAAV